MPKTKPPVVDHGLYQFVFNRAKQKLEGREVKLSHDRTLKVFVDAEDNISVITSRPGAVHRFNLTADAFNAISACYQVMRKTTTVYTFDNGKPKPMTERVFDIVKNSANGIGGPLAAIVDAYLAAYDDYPSGTSRTQLSNQVSACLSRLLKQRKISRICGLYALDARHRLNPLSIQPP